ncbi:MAG: signal peptidase I [Gallionella sp.]
MDFALIMFVLLLVTGSVWLLDIFLLAAKRGKEAAEPWWVEYAKSFFPVILVVFFIRSFLIEPFKIPSGSMIPTLQVGDFILVNKFTYGVRLPIINQKVIPLNDPQRGDVMVFRYPENPTLDYIKRVVGLPGDTVEYRGKQLWINGVEQTQTADGEYNYVESGLNFVHTEKRIETLGMRKHAVLINPEMPTVHLGAVAEFTGRENCTYDDDLVRCKVPAGQYFMMGDNRDNSRDSRYWGFVPDNQIVGKAFMIWMNFSDLKRIGTSIN